MIFNDKDLIYNRVFYEYSFTIFMIFPICDTDIVHNEYMVTHTSINSTIFLWILAYIIYCLTTPLSHTVCILQRINVYVYIIICFSHPNEYKLVLLWNSCLRYLLSKCLGHMFYLNLGNLDTLKPTDFVQNSWGSKMFVFVFLPCHIKFGQRF